MSDSHPKRDVPSEADSPAKLDPQVGLDFQKDPAILANVLNAMADGLFTVDAQGRFVAWNGGAERITGYSAQEVVGKSCHLLEGPNCKGFATLKDLLADPPPQATEGICHQECKLLSKDGRELYIHGNVRLLTHDDGTIAGAVGCFTDLTSFVLSNEKISLLEEQTRQRDAFDRLIGSSKSMQEVYRKLRLASQSDVTVFVSGESGTGKELAAQAIHNMSDRAEHPFIAVNCSAIPETLLESELFGHIKGAFTGAIRDKQGLFQAADGGTLFLDEIGDISPLLQLKLLRVLQEREVQRVGDERPQSVNVRLITATNQNLSALIKAGSFREDFYYRIHVFEIRMPPLRERKEDIPLLVNSFIAEFSQQQNRTISGTSRDAMGKLMDYEWPGNVRELRNAIEHAFVTAQADRIMLLDLPLEIRQTLKETDTDFEPLSENQQSEKQRILDALKQTGGNKAAAARLLGISRVTMWKKTKKYQIDVSATH